MSGGASRKLRVLVADDHPVVLEGLAAVIGLAPDLEVAATARDGHEAVSAYRRAPPDVALLDLQMPRLDGAAAIAAIRSEFPEARLLVISTFDGDEDIHRALAAGALGYVLKDSSREELLAAIRDVAAGRRHLPPAVAARLAERAGAGGELTAREREVLTLLAEGRSNREVAAALFIGENTVKTHVNRILEKLGAADRTEAVTTAVRRGILKL